jgi:hypothetical protein
MVFTKPATFEYNATVSYGSSCAGIDSVTSTGRSTTRTT